MKGVFVFSDTNWSLGRVHRGIQKSLENEFEFKYLDWATYNWTDFFTLYMWCDVCITNLVCLETLRTSFPQLDLKKCLFVSHGETEHLSVKEYTSYFNYGMTCECVKHLFPESVTPFLTPNGVDPDAFIYKQREGSLGNIGWCGGTHVQSKQINWAYEISARTDIPIKVASHFSYEEVKKWYHSIDILIITSIPEWSSETGPLPAFEAIVSGIPVIGTPVGNFRSIPGPKFTTIDQAVEILTELKKDEKRMKLLALEQYEYVISNFTYEVLSSKWEHALNTVAFQFS